MWAGGCGGLAAAYCELSEDPAAPGRWSEAGGGGGAGSRGAGGGGRGAAAAAAPLEAGDVGEAAAAAAAEAALRTRGKLLADRTPGRDVRGPPRPLCPRAVLGSRGRPCAPGPAGQQARGGGGNRARARRAGRRRPRSCSLGATWRDGGGGALGLVWGCRRGPQVGAGCGLRGHPLPTRGREGRDPQPPPCPPCPGLSEFGRRSPRRDSPTASTSFSALPGIWAGSCAPLLQVPLASPHPWPGSRIPDRELAPLLRAQTFPRLPAGPSAPFGAFSNKNKTLWRTLTRRTRCFAV